MRDQEFKDWLGKRRYKGAPLTATANSTRLSWLRAVERALPSMGFVDPDLDSVHSSGRWQEMLDRLSALIKDWRINEESARAIAPEAVDPTGQIKNAYAAARLYAHFANGEDPNYDAEVDPEDDRFIQGMEEFREIFLSRMYDFEDMRIENGVYWDVEKEYKYAARGDVLLFSKYPEWTKEQRGKAMYDRLCQGTVQGLPLSWRTRGEVRKSSSELQTRFYTAIADLASDGPIIDIAEQGAHALEQLREEGISSLRRGEVLNIILSVLGSLRPHECCWFKISLFDEAALKLVGKGVFPTSTFKRAEFEEWQNLLFRVQDVLEEWDWMPETLEDVQGFLWVALAKEWDEDWGPAPDPEAVEGAMAEYDELGPDAFAEKYPGFGTPMNYWVRGKGERAKTIYPSKPIAAVAMGWKTLHGGWSKPDCACSLLHRAGFEIVDANGNPVAIPDKPFLNSKPVLPQKVPEMPKPINLILYGPPGTGKTYRTATEAVSICDGSAPSNRDQLMRRYGELVDDGRIGFVTFHQSFSYEEFVEGLRPAPLLNESGDSAGFQLKPQDGVFKAMADAARKGVLPEEDQVSFDGRTIFKLSMGESGKSQWDWVFEDGIAEDDLIFGFSNVDWSDPRFESKEEILAAVRDLTPDENLSLNSNEVQSIDKFRNQLKKGDVVLISKGLHLLRAIGVVTGDYRYVPRPDGRYCHRRKVEWLWIDEEGVAIQPFFGETLKQFSMKTIYPYGTKDLHRGALERLANRGNETSDDDRQLVPHVLIIDEINRANISKVFGELITLLELDKRIGEPNAVTVMLPYSKTEFGVPSNLSIIGTMNTADRSIALLDTALRRRFVFREIEPDPSLLPIEVDGVPLRKVLETMNDRIEYLVDRERRLGHAFFMGNGGTDRAAIDKTMRDKIIPLLQEYFFEDWARVAAVLGEVPGKGGAFLDCRKLPDPTGQDGEERESWSVRQSFAPDAYRRLIGKAQFEEASEPSEGANG